LSILIESTDKYLADIASGDIPLSDDRIVLCYISTSDSLPFPGEGENEKMSDVYKIDYEPLHGIENWRHKLSNFWIQPFMLFGKNWASVEHVYQACKFMKGHPDFYHQFSLDSNSELSKDPRLSKIMGADNTKKRWYNGAKIRRSLDIAIDADFYSSRMSEKVILMGSLAKFCYNEDLKNLLNLTNHATIVHPVYSTAGADIQVQYGLMYIRHLIQTNVF